MPDKRTTSKGQKREILKMSDRVKSIQKGLAKNKEQQKQLEEKVTAINGSIEFIAGVVKEIVKQQSE